MQLLPSALHPGDRVPRAQCCPQEVCEAVGRTLPLPTEPQEEPVAAELVLSARLAGTGRPAPPHPPDNSQSSRGHLTQQVRPGRRQG